MEPHTSTNDTGEVPPEAAKETLQEVEALVDVFLQGPDFKALQKRRAKRRKTQQKKLRLQQRAAE